MKPLLAEVNLQDTPLGMGGQRIEDVYPNLGTLVTLLLRNSLTIAGVIMLGLLIFGGVMFIIGAGGDDPKKAAQAKTMITDSLIGFAVVFLAYFIIQLVQVVTGLKILNSSL